MIANQSAALSSATRHTNWESEEQSDLNKVQLTNSGVNGIHYQAISKVTNQTFIMDSITYNLLEYASEHFNPQIIKVISIYLIKYYILKSNNP